MNKHQKPAVDFDEFVKRQQVNKAEADALDWNREREEWLDYLGQLYDIVEEYLKPYIRSGTIDVSYREISLNEENIGQYQARQMIVKIGRQEVVFTPIGTVLIGTKGRVDVEGAAGRARLILTDRDSLRPEFRAAVQRGNQKASGPTEQRTSIDWTWKIATNPPHISYIELTKESLFDLVMEVANG